MQLEELDLAFHGTFKELQPLLRMWEMWVECLPQLQKFPIYVSPSVVLNCAYRPGKGVSLFTLPVKVEPVCRRDVKTYGAGKRGAKRQHASVT